MAKTKLYTIIIFSFASAMVDFLTLQQKEIIFPRDRIIHTILSALIACAVVFVLKNVNITGKASKTIAVAIILCRVWYLWHSFTGFFHTFYGSDIVAVTATTILLTILYCRYGYSGTKQMYSFFAAFNITLVLLVILLSAGRMNPANIYSNSNDFVFSFQKLFVFFDVVTIVLLCDDKKERICAQKGYIILTTAFIMLITLLEGLCASGNVLYSISPLQALMQIFTSKTVKRFDFVITLYCTLNYFAAVILYIWTVLKLTGCKKEQYNEKN